MLIKIGAVAKLIKRHESAVYKYITKGLLPKPAHRDQPSKSQFWCTDEVEKSLIKVIEYQTRSKSDKRATPKKKKLSISTNVRPPETLAQMAANNAFDLCVNIA